MSGEIVTKIVVCFQKNLQKNIALNVDTNSPQYESLIAEGARVLTDEEVEEYGLTKYVNFVAPSNTEVLPDGRVVFTPPPGLDIFLDTTEYVDSELGVRFREFNINASFFGESTGSPQAPFRSVEDALNAVPTCEAWTLPIKHIKLNFIGSPLESPRNEYRFISILESKTDGGGVDFSRFESIYLKGDTNPQRHYNICHGLYTFGNAKTVILEDINLKLSDENGISTSVSLGEGATQDIHLKGAFMISGENINAILEAKATGTKIWAHKIKLEAYQTESSNTAGKILSAINGGDIWSYASTYKIGDSTKNSYYAGGGMVLFASGGSIRFERGDLIGSPFKLSYQDATQWASYELQNNGYIDTQGGGPNFVPCCEKEAVVSQKGVYL